MFNFRRYCISKGKICLKECRPDFSVRVFYLSRELLYGGINIKMQLSYSMAVVQNSQRWAILI